MASYKFRRKYQTGGIIPSFQGYQALSQPQRIAQDVRPIEYDPTGAFQAIQSRNASLNTAISQANVANQERRTAADIEMEKRKLLTDELNTYYERSQASRDEITQLDYNSPKQFELAQQMNRELDRINEESTEIMVDSTLTPQQRGARLQEKYNEANKLMSNPDYRKHIQNNAIADKIRDEIAETLAGDNIIDYDQLSKNWENYEKFKNDEITFGGLQSNWKKFTIDPEYATSKINTTLGYIRDSMDKKKAPILHEKYAGDPEFLIYHGYMKIPSKEEQLNAIVNDYMNDKQFIKAVEGSGDGRFLDDKGYFDEQKFRDYWSGNLDLIRGGLGDDAVDVLAEIDKTKRTDSSSSSKEERQSNQVVKDLEGLGYEIITPSTVNGFESATQIDRIYNSDREELSDDEKKLYDEFHRGLRVLTPDEIKARDENIKRINTIQNNLQQHSNLNPGNNNNILPEKLDKNLGYYTNNPLNIKTASKNTDVPYIDRYDTESSGGYHRVFGTMEEGIDAGIDLIDRYKSGENATFRSNLQKAGKSIEDATLSDMYKTWATGASDAKIQKIADDIGVSPDTKISEIDSDDLFKGILSIENPSIYKDFYGSGGTQEQKQTEDKPQTQQDVVNIFSEYDQDRKSSPRGSKRQNQIERQAENLYNDMVNSEVEDNLVNEVMDELNEEFNLNYMKVGKMGIKSGIKPFEIFRSSTDGKGNDTYRLEQYGEENIYLSESEVRDFLKSLGVKNSYKNKVLKNNPFNIHDDEQRKQILEYSKNKGNQTTTQSNVTNTPEEKTVVNDPNKKVSKYYD